MRRTAVSSPTTSTCCGARSSPPGALLLPFGGRSSGEGPRPAIRRRGVSPPPDAHLPFHLARGAEGETLAPRSTPTPTSLSEFGRAGPRSRGERAARNPRLAATLPGSASFSAPDLGAVSSGHLGPLTSPVRGQQGLVNHHHSGGHRPPRGARHPSRPARLVDPLRARSRRLPRLLAGGGHLRRRHQPHSRLRLHRRRQIGGPFGQEESGSLTRTAHGRGFGGCPSLSPTPRGQGEGRRP